MNRFIQNAFLSSLGTALLLVAGCSDAPPSEVVDVPSTEASSTGDQAAMTQQEAFQPVRPSTGYDDPKQCVHDFLVAVRTGDDHTATALLTTAAQEEAFRNGLSISGEGFADASFEITEAQLQNDNAEAQVASTWSDRTAYGEEQTFQCVWLLRREAHGWCIYGMATRFLNNVQPVVLNFENQPEMQKRQKWAESEIRKQRELESHQQQALTSGDQPIESAVGTQATLPSEALR